MLRDDGSVGSATGVTRRALTIGALGVALTACSGGDDGGGDGCSTGHEAGSFALDSKAVVDAEAIALSPDGTRIAAGTGSWRRTANGPLRLVPAGTVWRAGDGATVTSWDGADASAWDPTGALIAGGTASGGIDLRDAGDGKIVRTLTGIGQAFGTPDLVGRVASMAFTPDGARLVATGYDGWVHGWHIGTGEHAWSRSLGCPDRPIDVAVNARHIACIGSGTSLCLLSVADGTNVELTPAAPTPAGGSASRRWGDLTGRGVAYSRDGRLLATGHGGSQGWVVIRDAATMAVVRTVELPSAPGRLAFSPDGRLLAVSLPVGRVVELVPVAGGPTRHLRGHTNAPEAVVFSPDGRTLYSASTHDGILGWDVASGRVRRRLKRPPAPSDAATGQ